MTLCIDEAGMGPWAGPLAVAAVIPSAIIQDAFTSGEIADSKKLSEARRRAMALRVSKEASWWGVRLVSVQIIDA